MFRLAFHSSIFHSLDSHHLHSTTSLHISIQWCLLSTWKHWTSLPCPLWPRTWSTSSWLRLCRWSHAWKTRTRRPPARESHCHLWWPSSTDWSDTQTFTPVPWWLPWCTWKDWSRSCLRMHKVFLAPVTEFSWAAWFWLPNSIMTRLPRTFTGPTTLRAFSPSPMSTWWRDNCSTSWTGTFVCPTKRWFPTWVSSWILSRRTWSDHQRWDNTCRSNSRPLLRSSKPRRNYWLRLLFPEAPLHHLHCHWATCQVIAVPARWLHVITDKILLAQWNPWARWWPRDGPTGLIHASKWLHRMRKRSWHACSTTFAKVLTNGFIEG